MSDYLPARVVTEILCKLPIKSLVQCTCVCKSWYFLIRSPAFICTHLSKTNNNNKKQLLLLFLHRPSNGEERYTLHLDDEQFNDHLDLHLPPTTCDHDSWNEVIGSCNGVLFVVHHIERRIDSCFFWNPLIRKSVFLPQLEPYSFGEDCFTDNRFGFGFDSGDNDYKVLRIARSALRGNLWKRINIEYEVYSLNTGTWKNVTSIAPNHEIDPCNSGFAFVNGSVHFLAFQRLKNVFYEEDRCNSVLAFDVGQKVFHEMMLPKPLVALPVTNELSVWAYKESSIAIVEKRTVLGNTHFCVWFMKEYGAEDSWTKLLVLNDHSLQTRRISGLATFRKNGELLLETSVQTSEEDFAGGLVSYDPESQQFRNVRFWWEEFAKSVFSYVESLVLLNFDESGITLPATKPFNNASPVDFAEGKQTSGAGLILETNAEFSVSDDDQATDRETRTSLALPSAIVASKSGSSLAPCDDEELTKLVSQLSAFEQALNINPILPEIPAESASFHRDERYATEVAQTFRAALRLLRRGPTILSSSATVSDLRKYLEFLTTHSLNAGMQVEQSNALANILKDLDQIVVDVSVQRQIAEEIEETGASSENFKAALSSEFGKLKAEMKKEASLARQIVELEAKLKALKADHTRAQVKINDLAKSSSTIRDVVANKQLRLQHLLYSEAEANTRFRQIKEMFAFAVHLMNATPL